MEYITSAVVDQLTASCSDCGITSDIIDRQSFACYPESPTYVTYRTRLEGTSETDSGSLISLIEDWVRGGASIIVTGVLMTVDSECSVAISSLSEGECLSPSTETPTTTSTATTTADSTISFTSSQGSYDNAAIIGGTVAIVIALIVAISLVITVALVLKHRHGSLSIKKAE